jgi:hypothetical protein
MLFIILHTTRHFILNINLTFFQLFLTASEYEMQPVGGSCEDVSCCDQFMTEAFHAETRNDKVTMFIYYF